jgi:cell division protein FtsW
MTVLGMLFIGGVQIRQFGILFLIMAVSLGILAYTSPYRLARLTSFLNPWADPFDSGFQLTQALIAFGRGEWFGVGLGSSIQKLFYLPEAHTDFVFAVLSEELGLFGGVIVITLFSIIVFRSFYVGRTALRAGNQFTAYLCFGLGLLLGMQAFINMGVNMGMLPTKGLTLPLMSYGGSSVAATCIIIALLLRCSHEYKPPQSGGPRSLRQQVRG